MENGMTTNMYHGVKNIAELNERVLKTFILLLALLATACQSSSYTSKDNTMIQLNLSVWQLIEDMQTAPLSLSGIEEILNQTLVEQTQQSNNYFRFYSGQPVLLAGHSKIWKIDLRLPQPSHDATGLLVIDIDGECITVEQVNKVFPNLNITSMPRGDSLLEATTFTDVTTWGKISFGFQEKRPDCLGYLVFEPNR